MPKGPCYKRKRNKEPKCTDHEECDWYPGRGCYAKESNFEPKISSREKKVESAENPPRYAKIFIADWEFNYKHPVKFPSEFNISVSNRDGNKEECYAPQWIYSKENRTNHIKCRSKKEYEQLETDYYMRYAEDKSLALRETTSLIMEAIINYGGGYGDLVENAFETGDENHPDLGLYIVDKDKNGELFISELFDIDDQFYVPPKFSLSEEFNPSFWSHAYKNYQVINISFLAQQDPEYDHSRDGASWYDDNTKEPLHVSKLKGLRKSRFSIIPDGIQVDLGFMKLLYYGNKSIDELHKAMKSKDIMSIFHGIDNTLYVQPLTNNKSIILEV